MQAVLGRSLDRLHPNFIDIWEYSSDVYWNHHFTRFKDNIKLYLLTLVFELEQFLFALYKLEL